MNLDQIRVVQHLPDAELVLRLLQVFQVVLVLDVHQLEGVLPFIVGAADV